MPLSPKQAITIIFDDSSYNSQKVDKLNEEKVNYINKKIYENSKSYGGCLVSVEKSNFEPFKNWGLSLKWFVYFVLKGIY